MAQYSPSPKIPSIFVRKSSDCQLKNILHTQTALNNDYHNLMNLNSSMKLEKFFVLESPEDKEAMNSSGYYNCKKQLIDVPDEKMQSYLTSKVKPVFEETGFYPLLNSFKIIASLSKKRVVTSSSDIPRHSSFSLCRQK